MEAFLEEEASELDLDGQAGMGHVNVRKGDTAESTLRLHSHILYRTGARRHCGVSARIHILKSIGKCKLSLPCKESWAKRGHLKV